MRIVNAITATVIGLALPAAVGATGFTDTGEDFRYRDEMALEVSGEFRVRAEGFYNLDLDHGLTPSGQALFAVPLSDPAGQFLMQGDLRFRTDWAFYAPGGSVAVKMRVDILDNLTVGSDPQGVLSTSISQQVPDKAFRIKRAYAEALTPFGVVAAGRMGSHWGLGMLTHGGDCLDCDSGDSADRIALITPLAGHIWAASFDLSATGPTTPRRRGSPSIDLDPADNVLTFTFAMLNWRDQAARDRRRKAGKTTAEYGAYLSYRFQDRDVPASYLPIAQPVALTSAQVMARNFKALAADAWLRITHPWFRLESEVAVLWGGYEQASLVPGVLLNGDVESLQIGAALETEFGRAESPVKGGLDAGFASGDPAPGFGAFVGPTDAAPRPGDFQGPQADVPRDRRVDNFQFHPDYRVDRILFRELIGTVTDAVYVRPYVDWTLAGIGAGELELSLAAIASFAVESSSAPGGESPLGVEIDPTIRYRSNDGFLASLEYAALFPLSGLDNTIAGLDAQPAQLLRLRLMYMF